MSSGQLVWERPLCSGQKGGAEALALLGGGRGLPDSSDALAVHAAHRAGGDTLWPQTGTGRLPLPEQHSVEGPAPGP